MMKAMRIGSWPTNVTYNIDENDFAVVWSKKYKFVYYSKGHWFENLPLDTENLVFNMPGHQIHRDTVSVYLSFVIKPIQKCLRHLRILPSVFEALLTFESLLVLLTNYKETQFNFSTISDGTTQKLRNLTSNNNKMIETYRQLLLKRRHPSDE